MCDRLFTHILHEKGNTRTTAVAGALVSMKEYRTGGLFDIFMPRECRSYLVSGWDARPLDRLPGVTRGPWRDEFMRKCITLAPGESFTLADLEGPGIISRIYFTFTRKWPRTAPRGLELLAYWDDEKEPSVCSPLGDFFGSAFCKYREYDSLCQSMQNGGYVSRFPMPFRRRARLVLSNSMDRKVEQIFYGISCYRGLEVPDDALYLHSCWRRTNPTREGEPHLLLEAEGRGHYAGCHLYQQNRDAWTRRRPDRWVLPGGAGMGHMEGWEEIFIDGEESPSHHGTGTEEYFNAGPYFTHGRSTGVLDGCTVRSYVTGRVAAYRFQVLDPVPFERSFRMIWHHGLLDSVRADFASTAFWYQDEPHLHFGLPLFDERLPSSTVPHSARAVVLWPIVLGAKVLSRLLGA